MLGDTICNLRQATRPELSAASETRPSGRAVHTLLSYVLLLVVAELCVLIGIFGQVGLTWAAQPSFPQSNQIIVTRDLDPDQARAVAAYLQSQ